MSVRPARVFRAHTLFVVTNGSKQLMEQTKTILRFLAKIKPHLMNMGVAIEVWPVRSEMLQNQKLIDKFRSKKITQFPALKTPNHIYLGIKNIEDIYSRAIKDWQRYASRGTASEAAGYSGYSTEDAYSAFIKDDIDIQRAAQDKGETPIGDSGDLMSQYQAMMKRRSDAMSKHAGYRTDDYTGGEGTKHSIRTSGGSNLGGEDDDIAALIDEVNSGPVTEDTIAAAFSADGGGDAQDDVLMRAFWENQSESL